METRSKAMAAIACVALAVLIGAGCTRCTMVHTGAQEQEDSTSQAAPEEMSEDLKDSLDGLLGTKWTSEDGKKTLSIINGAFLEGDGKQEEITYWSPDNATADDSGFSESIWASDGPASKQSPSLVRVETEANGGMSISCDSFKLAERYLLDAPEEVDLELTGNVGYLSELTGKDQAEISECLEEFVKQKCPYATAAGFDGEIYIDANSETTSASFTLNDPNKTIVTVVVDGKTGKAAAR